MNQGPEPTPPGPGRRTPRWFFVLIGLVGLAAGGLYLLTALTTGPLARNLTFAVIWGGLGILWMVSGLLLTGSRGGDR